MATRVLVEADQPHFRRLASRLRFAKVAAATSLVMGAAIDATLDEAIEQAHHYLDVFVYHAPLPPSAQGREAWYERHRRTHLTYDAVKKRRLREGAASGSVYVDQADYGGTYRGFFYALTLEFGSEKINYWARPFWRAMRAVMEIKFRGQMVAAAAKLVRVEMRRD